MIKKIFKNDILIRVIALICAVVLWFYVMAQVDPETTVEFRHIPISLEGTYLLEDKNLIILDGAQDEVNVTLRGPISVISRLSRENITAVVPATRLMSIISSGTYGINFDINVENGAGATVTDKSKSQVKLTIDKMVTRPVPVQITYEGVPAESCSISHLRIDPDAITVSGPESVMNTVKYASVIYGINGMSVSDVSQLPYELKDENDMTVDSDLITVKEVTVTASATVIKTAEVPLTVTVVPTQNVTEDMVKVEIDPPVLTLSGDPEEINILNQINLGSVNIETLLTWDLSEVIMPLTLPNGISGEDVPKQVKVKISYPNLVRKEIAIPSGSLPNIEGFVYSDDSLTLTVMGNDQSIAGLKTSNFIISPVLNDSIKQQDEARIPATVISRKGSIVILGKYYLNIEKAPVNVIDPVDLDGE